VPLLPNPLELIQLNIDALKNMNDNN